MLQALELAAVFVLTALLFVFVALVGTLLLEPRFRKPVYDWGRRQALGLREQISRHFTARGSAQLEAWREQERLAKQEVDARRRHEDRLRALPASELASIVRAELVALRVDSKDGEDLFALTDPSDEALLAMLHRALEALAVAREGPPSEFGYQSAYPTLALVELILLERVKPPR
jgi:hypothetical protein